MLLHRKASVWQLLATYFVVPVNAETSTLIIPIETEFKNSPLQAFYKIDKYKNVIKQIGNISSEH